MRRRSSGPSRRRARGTPRQRCARAAWQHQPVFAKGALPSRLASSQEAGVENVWPSCGIEARNRSGRSPGAGCAPAPRRAAPRRRCARRPAAAAPGAAADGVRASNWSGELGERSERVRCYCHPDSTVDSASRAGLGGIAHKHSAAVGGHRGTGRPVCRGSQLLKSSGPEKITFSHDPVGPVSGGMCAAARGSRRRPVKPAADKAFHDSGGK